MGTKKNKSLSCLMFIVLCAMTCFSSLNVMAETKKVEITGVGIFDQDPNKGIHTFDNGSKLIEVTFNSDFWNADKAATADGKNGNWLEWESAINDYLLINGKKPQEWITASWGSVTLYVKNSASLGQYLEINLSAYEGLPSESTDSTITFLKGFAGVIEKDVTYKYTANNNVPYVTNTGTGTGDDGATGKKGSVTGVGIFDQDPNKGIHTFDSGSKLIEVTFRSDFWNADKATTADGKNGNWLEWESAINDYLLINGKKPQEWITASWGSVTLYAKNSASLGQYLEINLSAYEGLPTESTDSTITFLKGFAGVVEEDVTYQYTANNNVPYVISKNDGNDEKPGNGGDDEETGNGGGGEAENTTAGEFKFTDDLIAGIGIFDQTPYKGIHDFGETRLIQIKFNQKFYDVSGLDASGTKLWVQSELGDYIKINGKTVTAWNSISFNSVQMHIKTDDALGGQYIEIIVSDLEGLPTIGKDSTIEILSNFPVWGGTKLKVANTFVYYGNENNPYVVTTAPHTGDISTAIPVFLCIVSLCITAIACFELKKGGAK